jgi:hypothetical protein
MAMTSGLRKFALTTHVTSSVGWLGAVGAFLALAIAGVGSEDAQIVRAAYLAMHLTHVVRHCSIVPGRFADRDRPIIGYHVGLVPTLLGRDETSVDRPCDTDLAGPHAAH